MVVVVVVIVVIVVTFNKWGLILVAVENNITMANGYYQFVSYQIGGGEGSGVIKRVVRGLELGRGEGSGVIRG